jgi:hypothetical protein
MKNGKNLVGYVIGLAALGLTVFVISKTWKVGQK